MPLKLLSLWIEIVIRVLLNSLTLISDRFGHSSASHLDLPSTCSWSFAVQLEQVYQQLTIHSCVFNFLLACEFESFHTFLRCLENHFWINSIEKSKQYFFAFKSYDEWYRIRRSSPQVKNLWLGPQRSVLDEPQRFAFSSGKLFTALTCSLVALCKHFWQQQCCPRNGFYTQP